ncbi:Cell division control protein 42 [Mycena sanguinolenta]|uniref:Cell division control protein 42 n=1 Tax=Mycena sanguinolenta TaxID=230812 RepID=A0A8H6YHM5_9AGAR|nr:Cell division control protein 42 [Mycena sanguinolenta]
MGSKPTIKCMLVGDSDVGKTCLLTAYTDNRFPTGYISRIYGGHGMDVVVRDVRYALGVFDNTGAPEDDRLRPLGYPQTDVFPRWLADAQHYCPGIPCILVATQIDLRQPDFNTVNSEEPRQMITTAQGEKLAREIKVAKFVECSALTREGVQDVFDEAIIAAVDHRNSPSTKRKMKCAVL